MPSWRCWNNTGNQMTQSFHHVDSRSNRERAKAFLFATHGMTKFVCYTTIIELTNAPLLFLLNNRHFFPHLFLDSISLSSMWNLPLSHRKLSKESTQALRLWNLTSEFFGIKLNCTGKHCFERCCSRVFCGFLAVSSPVLNLSYLFS